MIWPIVKLGDISEVITKGTTPTSVGFKFIDDGINFVKVESIDLNGKFLPSKFSSISEECNSALKRSQLCKGDILFSIAGALGRTALVTSDILPANTNQALAIIRIKQDIPISKPYLLLALSARATIEQVEKYRGGVAQQNLSLGQLKNFEIPLPSISDQKRIVAILDKAFAAIDEAKAKTEQNLKNARELFDSYLQQVFSQRGEGWVDTTLGDVAEVSSGGTPKRSTKEYWGGKIPWYSSGELNELYTIDSNDKISEAGIANSNAKLFPKGSLLIGMYDTAALKMSILDRDGTFNQAIAGVKPNSNISLEFILHSINFMKPELLKLRRGVRQKNLNQAKIKAIPIKLPPIDEQVRIVSELREMSKKVGQLVSIYSKKNGQLTELKKSLLQKAFSGELTANQAEEVVA